MESSAQLARLPYAVVAVGRCSFNRNVREQLGRCRTEKAAIALAEYKRDRWHSFWGRPFLLWTYTVVDCRDNRTVFECN